MLFHHCQPERERECVYGGVRSHSRELESQTQKDIKRMSLGHHAICAGLKRDFANGGMKLLQSEQVKLRLEFLIHVIWDV